MIAFLSLPEIGEKADRLKKSIESRITDERIEVYQSVEKLSQRLRQPHDEVEVAVLITSSYQGLRDVLSIKHLLGDLGIILVIPDQNRETITLAHQLRPRLLGYMSGDLSTIPSVLAKMLKIDRST